MREEGREKEGSARRSCRSFCLLTLAISIMPFALWLALKPEGVLNHIQGGCYRYESAFIRVFLKEPLCVAAGAQSFTRVCGDSAWNEALPVPGSVLGPGTTWLLEAEVRDSKPGSAPPWLVTPGSSLHPRGLHLLICKVGITQLTLQGIVRIKLLWIRLCPARGAWGSLGELDRCKAPWFLCQRGFQPRKGMCVLASTVFFPHFEKWLWVSRDRLN